MSRVNTVYAGLFGSHIALVLYHFASGSSDILLHSLIFITGTMAVLLFAVNKDTYENRLAFYTAILLLTTTFYSSLFLGEAGGQVFRWLVLVLWNIAQSRTMRIVDVSKVSIRNIIFNTLMLGLNLFYTVVMR